MPGTQHNRLDSWKAIADYLGRDVTTVIRWERDKGLPVHRVPGGKRHAVFAFPAEIDAWMNNGSADCADSTEVAPGFSPAQAVPRRGAVPAGVRPADADLKGGATTGAASAAIFQEFRIAYLGYGLTAIALTTVLVYLLTRSTPVPQVLGYTRITNDGEAKRGNIVTDGPRLFFAEQKPDGWAVAQVPTVGGEVVPLSSALKNPFICDLSLVRSELLANDLAGDSEEGQLFALPLSGGLPRPVGNVVARSAAWSPDGQAIAYTAEGGVYVCKWDGTEARNIVKPTGYVTNILWHPDGSLLRYTVSDPRSNRTSFWDVRPDGTNLRPSFPLWVAARVSWEESWTWDGHYFIFLSSPKSGWAELWALGERERFAALRRRSLVRLTAGPLELESTVPSRDGKRVFAVGSITRQQFERYDLKSKRFLPFLPDLSANYADFTRDWEWIAYVSSPDQTLWKRRVNGVDLLQLTFPPLEVVLPSWSPDGKWIAFLGRAPGEPWKVRVISAAGGLPQTVTSGNDQEGAPTWSPDCTRLTFGGLASPDVRSPAPLVIHLVDLRTHQSSTLPGSEGLWTARWSPSGRYLAALTADSQSLMLFDFSTQKWVKLLTVPAIRDITWSRREEAIFLTCLRSQGGVSVCRLRLSDRKLEEFASLQESAINTWMGLTPDDSPLLDFHLGEPEIYALDWELP